MAFCQNPAAPMPLGKRCRFSGPTGQVGQHRGGDPDEVVDQFALGDRLPRRSPAAGGTGPCPGWSASPTARRPPRRRGRAAPPGRRAPPGSPSRSRARRPGTSAGRRRWGRPAASASGSTSTACSRTTSRGSRPRSRPLKEAWRTIPSRDHPPRCARITSSGRTQTTPARSPPQRPRCAGSGAGSNGGASTRSGSSRDSRSRPGSRAEPGPHLAREPQGTVLVHAHDERAQVPAALLGCPAAHDELLLGSDLDLQPGRRPLAGQVGRGAVLGHDPLDALLAAAAKNVSPLGLDMPRVAHHGPLAQDQAQQLLALLQGDAEQRAAIQVQQVEHLVDQPGAALARHGPRRSAPGAARSRAGRPGVERHDLPVDDRLARRDPGRWVQQPREVVAGVVAVAREQAHGAVADHGLDTVAVPLHLEEPGLVGERVGDQRHPHRRDEGGKGLREPPRTGRSRPRPRVHRSPTARAHRPAPRHSSGRCARCAGGPRRPSRPGRMRRACGSAATGRCPEARTGRAPVVPGRGEVRTRTNRPRSFSPCSTNFSSPASMAARGSGVSASGSQVPQSQTMTSPAPYWPLGITPSKSRYSTGWSSTWTAIRRTPASRLGPRGTAQLTRTPATSRRRS